MIIDNIICSAKLSGNYYIFALMVVMMMRIFGCRCRKDSPESTKLGGGGATISLGDTQTRKKQRDIRLDVRLKM